MLARSQVGEKPIMPSIASPDRLRRYTSLGIMGGVTNATRMGRLTRLSRTTRRPERGREGKW